jgi:hypothetical protein
VGSALQANASAVLAACAGAYPQGGPQRRYKPLGVSGTLLGVWWWLLLGAAARTGMARVAGCFLPLVMVWDGAQQRRRL